MCPMEEVSGSNLNGVGAPLRDGGILRGKGINRDCNGLKPCGVFGARDVGMPQGSEGFATMAIGSRGRMPNRRPRLRMQRIDCTKQVVGDVIEGCTLGSGNCLDFSDSKCGARQTGQSAGEKGV